jgi:hypothetical protein
MQGRPLMYVIAGMRIEEKVSKQRFLIIRTIFEAFPCWQTPVDEWLLINRYERSKIN